jgi:hypothetical protein
MKSRILLFQAIILVILNSCKQQLAFNEDFILKSNGQKNNQEELSILDSELGHLSNIASIKANISLVSHEGQPFKVDLKKEVSKLFDPDNGFCSLPDEVTKALKHLKSKGKSWAPEYVVRFLKDLPDSAMYVPRTSVAALLHSYKIKDKQGLVKDWVAFSAPTFSNFDIDQFILTKGYNSFFYSLDCSGYFNAAIAGAGAVAIADIKTSAKSAMDQKKSLFIGGGVLISPIAAAYYENELGLKMDTLTMIKILRAVETTPDVNENDTILLLSNYETIWMSMDGNSSFNGEANFSGNVRAGIGVASFSANLETGTNLTRKTSFTSYKTYYTSRSIIPELKPFSVKEVRIRRTSLEKLYHSR